MHVAALFSDLSVVTWDTSPDCQPVPLGCSGTYAGTSFQFVDSTGAKVGSPVSSTSFFVSGDMANVGTNKVCWPYVDMTWDPGQPLDSGTPIPKMSFACASSEDSTAVSSSSSVAEASSSTAVFASSSIVAAVAEVTSSSVPVVVQTSADSVIASSSTSSFSAAIVSLEASVYISTETVVPGGAATPVSPSSSTAETSLTAVEEATSSAAGIATLFSFSNPVPSSLPQRTRTMTAGGTGANRGRPGYLTTFQKKTKPIATATPAATSADDEYDDVCE